MFGVVVTLLAVVLLAYFVIQKLLPALSFFWCWPSFCC